MANLRKKRNITIRVSSRDGLDERKSFQRLGPARRFAHRYVGEHPDYSERLGYAVDSFGMTKVEASGATMAELFPERQSAAPTRCECDDLDGEFDTRFDPVTGMREVICAYCVSPPGVAKRRKQRGKDARRRMHERRRSLKRLATHPDEIPF